MKLNIGCGYNYLAGYINIDSGADSLADRKMEAHSLDFDDASAAEIRAAQLIEHLGFFKTKYFLAECRRVLEPGGLLVLETPHIEKTFEIFAKGGRVEKEAALGWVYGSETSGMNHLYCFPESLLKELAGTAGFELLRTEYFDYQPARPALRLTLAKAVDEGADFEAAFRRELTRRKAVLSGDGFRPVSRSCGTEERFNSTLLPLSGDEYAAAEQEKLIKVSMTPVIFNDNGKSFELALYQPDLAAAFFSVRNARGMETEGFLKAAERLCGIGLTARLYQALKARPPEEKQQAAFEAALETGRGILKKALAGSAAPAPGRYAAGYPAIFSFEMARIHSRKSFCAGLKASGLRAFSEAGTFFTDALAFYRDDPGVWLQHARNLKNLGEAGASVSAYGKALELFKGQGPAGAEMAAALRKEMGAAMEGI